MDVPSSKSHNSAAKRPMPLQRAGCWLSLGMLAGILLTLAVVRWKLADPTPSLTEETFAEARQRWEVNAPADYDVEIKVEGRQPATYRVQVRDGQSIAAFRNGQPLSQQRTFGTWSVPGMFGTIRRDLDQIERRRSGRADRHTPNLTLRARFDPKLGYPDRYLRMEAGSTQDVSWDVVEFVVRRPD